MHLLPIVEDLFVDDKFTTNVHDKSAIFFFFNGFNDLTIGVSDYFHLTGKFRGFCRIFSSSNFRASYSCENKYSMLSIRATKKLFGFKKIIFTYIIPTNLFNIISTFFNNHKK